MLESENLNHPYKSFQLESPFLNVFENPKLDLDEAEAQEVEMLDELDENEGEETESLYRETLDELELDRAMEDEFDHYEEDSEETAEFEDHQIEEDLEDELDWDEEDGEYLVDVFDLDKEGEYYLEEEDYEAEKKFQPRKEQFASKEHQSLGKEAAGSFKVNLSRNTKSPFKVFFGDVVALSGDYFKPVKLIELAGIPGRRGDRKGSRDEIIYALNDFNAQDRRFQSGGPWENYKFSDEVKKAVSMREHKLAASNESHFLAPWGRLRGQVINKGNAVIYYLYYHKKAIYKAYYGGQVWFTHAMAIEAAAHHFLTDAFAAGHIRTPVSLIRKFWSKKYPIFSINLFWKIALDTAVKINERETNTPTILGSVMGIFEDIMKEVHEIEKDLPKFSLGDLIGLAFHDYDNDKGVIISAGKKLYGDKKLSLIDKDTRALIIVAMQAGINDIKNASALSKKGNKLSKMKLIKAVQQAAGAPTGKFLVETKFPQPDKRNPQQNWEARTFWDLWGQTMVGNSGPTFGQYIENAIRDKNSSIRKELDGIAAKFPVKKSVVKKGIKFGTVHPQIAFLQGFVEPLVKNPKKEILNIIHWAPNYGLHSIHRNNIALATAKKLLKKRALGGMKLTGRVHYIKALIGGVKVSVEEEKMVLNIFATAPSFQRPIMYKLIENHPWKGNWVQGWNIDDDDLWNALSRSRLSKLREMINQGVRKKS